MAIKYLHHLQAHSCKDSSSCEVRKNVDQNQRHHYKMGFQECMFETIRFLMETDGMFNGEQSRMQLVKHLQKHYNKINEDTCINNAEVLNPLMSTENIADVPLEEEAYLKPSTPSDEIMPPSRAVDSTRCHHIFGKKLPLKISYMCTDLTATRSHPEVSVPLAKSLHSDESTVESQHSSQLREMLQNPGLPVSSNTRNTCSAPGSSRVLQKGKLVYKFKQNIKERFTADQQSYISLVDTQRNTDHSGNLNSSQHQSHSPPGMTNSLSCSPGILLTHCPLILHSHELTAEKSSFGGRNSPQWDNAVDSSSSCRSNPSPSSTVLPTSSNCEYSANSDVPTYIAKRKYSSHRRHPTNISVRSPSFFSPTWTSGIPVFALHPKGTFYIPLTLDAGLLDPFVNSHDDKIPVLHPVSISVNFSFSGSIKDPENMNDHSPDSYISDNRQEKMKIMFSVR
ncbi:transcription factor cwo-like [Limulus polyphemus]|uniref:Transcription factor cwo-like n=1 Tax=Limulus polyphemus TaxID=6850 RepID=A0ABM1RW27_LIMPO|nr:transcription factor cwo-like [Limulus polyphemus]